MILDAYTASRLELGLKEDDHVRPKLKFRPVRDG